MTPAGKRDTRGVFKQKSVGRDAGTGEEVVAWTVFDTRWVSMVPIRGREYFAAAQTQSSVDYRCTVLKPFAVTREMRIEARGKVMDIVELIEHQDEFELMCSTGIRNAI